MCGLVTIVGYAADAPSIDRGELLAIRDAMAARGPDGAGLWTSPDGRVGLAHRRLSLLDVSEAGAQPMANEDGSLQIVFNGEIYNYRELRRSLETKGFRFRSGTDTEVLLHLYADQGPQMMHAPRGMYAFVIWDERNKRVFAARDPLGIKPLYYADDGKTLRIASQVKALLKGGAVSNTRDAAGQAGFMLLGYVPEPFTTYQAIRNLPAGSFLIAAADRPPVIHQFCRIEEELAAAASGNGKVLPPGEMRERLRGVVSDSVSRHLIADVPVGIFLSAGIDSSVVTALASELPRAQLHTITLGAEEYHDTENDETVLAAAVAETYGTRHETRWIARSELSRHRDRIIEAMDQPSIDGVNTYFVAKAAHEAGLKAALSGIGGDEMFGGYPSFRQVPRMAGSLARLLPRQLGRTLRMAMAPLLETVASPKYAGLCEYGGSYAGAYLLRRALFMPWELSALLEPEVARRGLEALQIESLLERTVGAIASPHLRVAALEMNWYMRNQLLRDSDWAGMAHSLEIRTPLADIVVVREVACFAANAALARNKRDLARLPGKVLPPAVMERKKTGFKIPVDQFLTVDDGKPREHDLRKWGRCVAREFGFEMHDSARDDNTYLHN